MKKYEILYDNKIEILGHTLYRIRACKDFGDVEAGDLGGYIEKPENLSQEGDCWVYDNARVYGNARVYSNALVYDDAEVYGDVWVYGNARVCGNVCVYGDTEVYGKAWVCGNARVYGNAHVYGNARVYGNAEVYGDARVYGNAWVYVNAEISKSNDVLCITPIGSRNGTTTFFKTKDNNICVTCDCFYGTIDEFLERVSETHGENKHAKAYKLACELARVQIELEDKINE